MTPLEAHKRKLGFVISCSRIEQLHAEKELLEGRINQGWKDGPLSSSQKLIDDLWAVNAALLFAKERATR